MARRSKPHLITDAERTPEQELRAREVRYVVMMLLRAACVITAAVLVMVQAPLLPLWLTLCVLGAVVLPWAAVLLANDRSPKPEHRLRNRLHRQGQPDPQAGRALTEAQPDHPRVIDAEL